jgi:antitoxin component YwqK of YwqJK toxin-antitoxin module
MNRISILIILLFSIVHISSAQFLNLPDLVTLCNSSDLEQAGEFLKQKNWSLAESDASEEDGMQHDSWSYGVNTSEYFDEYSSMAPGYINLVSGADKIAGVYYTVFEYDLYNTVFDAMKENGFKKHKTKELKRDGLTAYTNGDLLLLFNVEDIYDDENPDATYTAYTVYLVKKPSAGTPGESGPRKDYYEGGAVRAEYTLKDGQADGVVKIYDITGFVIQESNYRNGELNGERRFYYPSIDQNTGLPIEEAGQLYLVSNYKDGVEHGTETWYFQTTYRTFPCETTDSAGVVISDTCRQLTITKGLEIINYRKGILHGNYELYDQDGALVSKGKYKKGMETGKWFRKPE